jgi:hypothetical protein
MQAIYVRGICVRVESKKSCGFRVTDCKMQSANKKGEEKEEKNEGGIPFTPPPV